MAFWSDLKASKMIKKVVDFLRASNHWKHLVGGILIGLCAFGAWNAFYAALIAASCLELKDKLWGGDWDWKDWIMTVAGSILSAILWLSICIDPIWG